MKKILLLSFFAILSVVPLSAQSSRSNSADIDSIAYTVAALSSDTARVNYYYRHITSSMNAGGGNVALDRLEGYAETALELSIEIDYIEGRANINQALGSIYWLRQNYRRAGEYYRESLRLWESTKDIGKIAQQTFNIGLCEYRSGMYGEALEYYLVALSYYKELSNRVEMFRCYNAISNAYFYVGDYVSNRQSAMEALELANTVRDTFNIARFSINVADASKRLNDSTQAIEYYDRAIEICKQSGNISEAVKALINKATAYTPTSTQKLATFLNVVEILEELTPQTAESLTYLSHTYVNIGIWYAATNDHKMAVSYFDKALTTVQRSGNRYEMIFQYSHIASYYFEQANHTKAKQFAEQAITLIKTSVGANHNFDIALRILSKIYANEGNYRKAFGTLEEWSVVNDSIKAKDLREQMSKINRQYEFERHRQDRLNAQQLDIERHELSILAQRNMIAGLIGVCILLFIIGLVIFIYSRQLRAKNRLLYKQIQEQDKLEQEVEAKNISINQNSTDGGQIRNGKLFAALKELMKNESVYTQTDVDRKVIAEMLNTNERYLFESIKENAGLSFAEYINTLRLNFAKELLMDSSNLTIEDIAIRSGFGSRATFHRQFREKYKLSPAEFRKVALREKEN